MGIPVLVRQHLYIKSVARSYLDRLGHRGFSNCGRLSLQTSSLNPLWLNPLLTHLGRVAHICISNLAIIGSDNGLSLGRRQAIIWTNDGILSIRPLRTNISEIEMEIHIFSFKKMYLKMSSGKWRPFCNNLNVLSVFEVYVVIQAIIHICPKVYQQILIHIFGKSLFLSGATVLGRYTC